MLFKYFKDRIQFSNINHTYKRISSNIQLRLLNTGFGQNQLATQFIKVLKITINYYQKLNIAKIQKICTIFIKST